MKLILVESVTGLGNPGELVDVKSGYGRNFLLPSGKAIVANDENLKVYEAKRKEIESQEEKKLDEAKSLFDKVNEFNIELEVQVSEEGTMYGSVGTKEISDRLIDNNFEIDRSMIRLPEGSLKELGESKIDIELNPDVIASVNLKIKAEEI